MFSMMLLKNTRKALWILTIKASKKDEEDEVLSDKEDKSADERVENLDDDENYGENGK